MNDEHNYVVINIGENICLSRSKGCCQDIEDTCVKVVNITSILESTDVIVDETKRIDISGDIQIRLYLRWNRCRNCYYTIKKMVPFRTYIMVPKDVCQISQEQVRYSVQDVTTTSINSLLILVSVTICITYEEEYVEDRYASC